MRNYLYSSIENKTSVLIIKGQLFLCKYHNREKKEDIVVIYLIFSLINLTFSPSSILVFSMALYVYKVFSIVLQYI